MDTEMLHKRIRMDMGRSPMTKSYPPFFGDGYLTSPALPVPTIRKVLSGKKAATLIQLNRLISMMTDVQFTSRLPLNAEPGRTCTFFLSRQGIPPVRARRPNYER